MESNKGTKTQLQTDVIHFSLTLGVWPRTTEILNQIIERTNCTGQWTAHNIAPLNRDTKLGHYNWSFCVQVYCVFFFVCDVLKTLIWLTYFRHQPKNEKKMLLITIMVVSIIKAIHFLAAEKLNKKFVTNYLTVFFCLSCCSNIMNAWLLCVIIWPVFHGFFPEFIFVIVQITEVFIMCVQFFSGNGFLCVSSCVVVS